MIPIAKESQSMVNTPIRFVQKVSILGLLFLFLLSGSFTGKEAVAESAFGRSANTPNETGEAKADFLFKQPSKFFGFRVGMLFPLANSDIFDMVTKELTLGKSDFRAWDLGVDGGFSLFEMIDLVFRYDYSDRSKTSEFRDYVDEQNLPITQTTELLQSSVTAGIRYLFAPRGRGVGQYAWLPNRFVPFVEAGGGALWYRFEQRGDFVDNATLEIFSANLSSSGWTPTLYLGGGVDIHVIKSTYLTLDLRYSWAEHDMSRSFTGFDPIDLSGIRVTAGINWYY